MSVCERWARHRHFISPYEIYEVVIVGRTDTNTHSRTCRRDGRCTDTVSPHTGSLPVRRWLTDLGCCPADSARLRAVLRGYRKIGTATRLRRWVKYQQLSTPTRHGPSHRVGIEAEAGYRSRMSCDSPTSERHARSPGTPAVLERPPSRTRLHNSAVVQQRCARQLLTQIRFRLSVVFSFRAASPNAHLDFERSWQATLDATHAVGTRFLTSNQGVSGVIVLSSRSVVYQVQPSRV